MEGIQESPGKDVHSNLVSGLGLCLLGTRWQIPHSEESSQLCSALLPHLTSQPWGPLLPAVPGRAVLAGPVPSAPWGQPGQQLGHVQEAA